MSREQLGMRLLCSGAGVDSQNARTGRLTEQDFYALADAMVPLEGAPIYIDDTAIIGPGEMMAKIRRLKSQVGEIGLVVIDYLQLMTAGGRIENRQQEISTITRSLKVAAKELNVPDGKPRAGNFADDAESENHGKRARRSGYSAFSAFPCDRKKRE